MKRLMKRLACAVATVGLTVTLTSGAAPHTHVHAYTFIYDPPFFWGYCYDVGCGSGLCCFVLEE